MVLLGIAEFVCLIGIPVTLVGFLVQFARKKANKKAWGITLICFLVVFVVCFILTPTSEEDNKDVAVTTDESSAVTSEQGSTEGESEKVVSEQWADEESQNQEKTEAEKFAESNDVSVSLAESLESVLADMELTDKSRVGVFHYNLSQVYEWKQIEDWADGQRYSAYMDMEHVWYIYVKNNIVVGIRDGNGNIFYSEE